MKLSRFPLHPCHGREQQLMKYKGTARVPYLVTRSASVSERNPLPAGDDPCTRGGLKELAFPSITASERKNCGKLHSQGTSQTSQQVELKDVDFGAKNFKFFHFSKNVQKCIHCNSHSSICSNVSSLSLGTQEGGRWNVRNKVACGF